MNFIKHKTFTINLIKNTRIFFCKQNIFISGPRGLVMYKQLGHYNQFVFNVSKKNLCFFEDPKSSNSFNKPLKLFNLLNTLIFNVHYFFSKKLILVGIGIRAWVKYLVKKQKKVLLIKIGFSKDLYIEIPKNLIVFSLRPTLLLIRGLNKEAVSLFSCSIKQLKKPDSYKGKGIQYQNETVLLKPGKKS